MHLHTDSHRALTHTMRSQWSHTVSLSGLRANHRGFKETYVLQGVGPKGQNIYDRCVGMKELKLYT